MKKLILGTLIFVLLESSLSAFRVGSCVKFSIIGTGLLNGNKTIYVKGRVTGNAGNSSFVKIISMKGGSSFYNSGKDYYQGDEIEVPNRNLAHCR